MPLRYSAVVLCMAFALAFATGCVEQSDTDMSATVEPAPGNPSDLPCAPDNGGIDLPDGFCAAVVADSVGRARHLVVDDNGDLFVSLRDAENGGGVAALRDTDGDGRADETIYFGAYTGTGIELTDEHLYFGADTTVVRYPRTPGQLMPTGEAEVVVTGLPRQNTHNAKPFAFDGAGNLYLNIGAPSNACQEQARTPGSMGLDPCPQRERQSGVWRFGTTPGQTQLDDGERYAAGIRNAVAIAWHPLVNRLFVVQHGRDQLNSLFPDLYTEEESSELPSEEFFVVDEGDDFGWPYCYNDHTVADADNPQGVKVLAPEYGGDGSEVGRCADFEGPIVAFPGHYAPNDLLFYTGDQFPGRYQGGAFVAFHGSWNRQPPQRGYQVAFVPMDGATPVGEWETFAEGFAGEELPPRPNEAEYRPTGLALGPDGSLYIADSVEGKIWRVVYKGDEMGGATD